MGPRHRKQRSVVVKAESMDHSGVCPPDVQQVLVIKEEVPIGQDEWDPSLEHDDSNPLYIKEEDEEFCIGQEREQHEGLDAENGMFPFHPLISGRKEAISRFSQLHQSQSTAYMRGGGPQASCSANDIKTEDNWMDGYESEPDSLDPGNKPIYISETESEDEDHDKTRKRIRKSQSLFWEKNGIPIYKLTMMPLSQLQPLVSGKGKFPRHISSSNFSGDMSRQTFSRAGVPNMAHFQPLVSGKPKASHHIGSLGFSAEFPGKTFAVQRAGVFKPSHIGGSSVTPGSAVTPQNLQPVGWLYGDPVYAIGAGGFTPPYSAALPKNASMSVKPSPESKRKKEDKPYIKKPPNSFMLFMKEQRQNIVAECNVKESATVNQILGMKWKSMSDEEQAKYYEMAHKERILHSQMYPDWSPSDNYAKKKKRTRVKPVFAMEALGEDPSLPKRLCVFPGSEDRLQPQTVVFMPPTQTAALKSQRQTLVLHPTVQNATVKPQPQTVMLQPAMQHAIVKPQTGILQPAMQNPTINPQTVMLQSTTQNVIVKPQAGLLEQMVQNGTGKSQTVMQNALVKHQTGLYQPPTLDATVKHQTGLYQPTMQDATVKHQTGLYQPTMQNATVKPRTGILQPTTQNATVKPRTGILQPTTQNATVKPQTESLQPTTQNATVKPQTESLQPTTQNPTVKPQTGISQPTMHNSNVIPQPLTSVLQTAQNAAGIPKPPTFVLQPTAQAVAGNLQTQSSALKSQMQSVAINPQIPTTGANPKTQTVVLQPHTQTVVLQPHTQTVVLQHQTSASRTAMLQTNIIPQPKQRQMEEKPYIKKPPNAFMLFMREQRPNVIAQYNMKESATVNQILGQKWNALTREEQAKYFELARQEKIIHSQLYPDWSPNTNPKRRRKVRVESYARTEAPVPAFAEESSQPKMPPALSGSDRTPHTQTVVIEPHTQTLVFKPHTQAVVLKLGTQSVVMPPHNVSTHKQANVNQATASIVDSIET